MHISTVHYWRADDSKGLLKRLNPRQFENIYILFQEHNISSQFSKTDFLFQNVQGPPGYQMVNSFAMYICTASIYVYGSVEWMNGC